MLRALSTHQAAFPTSHSHHHHHHLGTTLHPNPKSPDEHKDRDNLFTFLSHSSHPRWLCSHFHHPPWMLTSLTHIWRPGVVPLPAQSSAPCWEHGVHWTHTWAWTCWPPEEWVCASGHCQGQPRIWASHLPLLAFSQPRVAPVTAAAALRVTLVCCRSPRLHPTLMSPQPRCLHRPAQLQWCCEALCCS